MKNKNQDVLITIKAVHTIIWIAMILSVFYVFYAGITNTTNLLVWISIGMILIEGSALFLNHWTCPVSTLARRYTKSKKANFDIYLPVWLMKFNRNYFAIIFFIGLFLVLYNNLF